MALIAALALLNVADAREPAEAAWCPLF